MEPQVAGGLGAGLGCGSLEAPGFRVNKAISMKEGRHAPGESPMRFSVFRPQSRGQFGSVFVNVGREMILPSDLMVEPCPPVSYRSPVRACPWIRAEREHCGKNLR